MAAEITKDVDIQRLLTSIRIEYWSEEVVFSFRWWLLMALILLSLIVWYRSLNKSSLHEATLFAGLASIVTLALYEYGLELTLLDFNYNVIPIFPPLSSLEFLLFPLIFSYVFQHFNSKKRYIKASLAASAILSFVINPLLSWGEYYILLHWSYFYDFVVLFLLALLLRMLANKIISVQNKYKIQKQG